MVVVIECILNQNARDQGAACHPASNRAALDLLANAQVGMMQIPCPEMACLGIDRRRAAGQSLRQALEAPQPSACCRRLAEATAERIQGYCDRGYQVPAILGGNPQSPGCAVHPTDESRTRLDARSGVFMLALATALEQRGLAIPFRGLRDADAVQLDADLDWLQQRLRRG